MNINNSNGKGFNAYSSAPNYPRDTSIYPRDTSIRH